jgi:hypothetical protein
MYFYLIYFRFHFVMAHTVLRNTQPNRKEALGMTKHVQETIAIYTQ